MTRANALFSGGEHQQVTEAVVAAESNTSAEIMPVVAKSSGRYDRPEDIAGLWFGMLALCATWFVLPGPAADPNSWSGMTPAIQPSLLIVAILIGFLVGVLLASRLTWLRALFTPRAQAAAEVMSRARSVFFDRRVHHTSGGTGLLIYVSLFEHQAAVLADQVVLEKLGQPTLDEICEQLTTDLRSGTIPDAICKAIATAGEKLSAVLPRDNDDVNELTDALVVLD
jgi:putative membrane protein